MMLFEIKTTCLKTLIGSAAATSYQATPSSPIYHGHHHARTRLSAIRVGFFALLHSVIVGGECD